MDALRIYSEHKSARLRYVLDFTFKQVLDQSYVFTRNVDSDIDFHYGSEKYPASSYIIEGSACTHSQFRDGKLYLNKETFFDPIAAIFFCLSREEEYQCTPDAHGRFKPENSVFYGYLNKPWVDIWVSDWLKNLGIKAAKPYKFLCTVDLDFGYKYLGKGFLRTTLAIGKSFLTFKFKTIGERISALFSQKDPYEKVYVYLTERFKPNQLRFFALIAPFSKFDRGLKPRSQAWKRLQKKLQGYAVGLHPSYYQMEDKKLLPWGKYLLEDVGFEVDALRFHFLRYQWPTCLQHALEIGIKHDFSMGYAQCLGFRAQTAYNFHFYDVRTERETPLLIHPFVAMDAVLVNYKLAEMETLIHQIKTIQDQIIQYGGNFCIVWHEHTLVSGSEGRLFFEKTLKACGVNENN